MYNKVNPKQSFPKLEEEVLEFWNEEKIFEESMDRPDAEEFNFYDGPPFATWTPHYGHILAGTIKDVIPRYQTMLGKKVERRFGWDTHGLPIENIVEKKMWISGKDDIEKMWVHAFNEECRANVFGYVDEWKKTVNRMGRWVDMENDYKTMDTPFMESVWWVFKSIYDKGLVYEGNRIVPYCPRCTTPLSNFEVNQGYKDKQSKTVTVKFPVVGNKDKYLLAWTTTPWTIPSVLSLAVWVDLEYSEILDKATGETYVLASDLIKNYYKNEEDYTVTSTVKWSCLVGLEIEPAFDDFKIQLWEMWVDMWNNIHLGKNSFKVVPGHHVTTEAGTGIVTTAPGYWEDDYKVAQDHDCGFVTHLDDSAKVCNLLNDEWNWMFAFDFNDVVLQYLKDQKKTVHIGTIDHSYPHCWRCDTPLIYRAISAWYVAVEKIRDKMVANNLKTNWTPESIKEWRFGKWLEGARDWNISRNRYWGSAMPVWQSEDKKSEVVIGSIEELYEANKDYGQIEPKDWKYIYTNTWEEVDIHKHFVDEIFVKCPKTWEKLKRIPEVLDCWFESGSMPYASKHYPFEGKEDFKFPADFIAEGLDQTRGWFYTLIILSTALFESPATMNTIVNWIVLADDGRKMSKSLNNYPAPELIFDKYGADAMRFYLMNSPVVEGQDMRFTEGGVEEVVKKVILPLWNTYSFFVTYANIDGFEAWEDNTTVKENPLDQWILSELHILINEITTGLDWYRINEATKNIPAFMDNLTNWYIRRSRKRFWKSENDGDKIQAYSTLHTVLVEVSKCIAPFMPFVAENIYQNLTGNKSVHLELFPTYEENLVNKSLSEQMDKTKKIINLGLAWRVNHKLKVRQPLKSVTIWEHLEEYYQNILMEELNVKEVIEVDGNTLAKQVCKPNGRAIGPKFGKDVKFIMTEAKSWNFELLDSGNIKVWDFELETGDFELVFEAWDSAYEIEAGFGMVIALDSELTPELEQEWMARDLVRFIQDARKEAEFNVEDRIEISISWDNISKVLETFGKYIETETLSTINSNLESSDLEKEVEIWEEKIILKLKK